ncbi:18974_t:CDS:1, partial [Dentiscutata erythropus]
INGIAYDLASSAPTTVAGNSRLNLLRKELHSLKANYLITEATKIPFITEKANQIQARKRILHGINGYDCPKFFYLEKVQERLNKCNITKSPSMQNLIDIMIMLCIRSADVKNLCINRYKPSRESWYNPDYSWYCIGYAKNKGEVEEPWPFLSIEKNLIQARELLIWIQRSIPDKFPFLLKNKNGNTNVAPLNQFLSRYRITSYMLRKIGADHAFRVHGGRNDSCYQYLWQLACRHKIDHALSVKHYGVMNDRPNAPAPKQENSEVEDIIDLYNY